MRTVVALLVAVSSLQICAWAKQSTPKTNEENQDSGRVKYPNANENGYFWDPIISVAVNKRPTRKALTERHPTPKPSQGSLHYYQHYPYYQPYNYPPFFYLPYPYPPYRPYLTTTPSPTTTTSSTITTHSNTTDKALKVTATTTTRHPTETTTTAAVPSTTKTTTTTVRPTEAMTFKNPYTASAIISADELLFRYQQFAANKTPLRVPVLHNGPAIRLPPWLYRIASEQAPPSNIPGTRWVLVLDYPKIITSGKSAKKSHTKSTLEGQTLDNHFRRKNFYNR